MMHFSSARKHAVAPSGSTGCVTSRSAWAGSLSPHFTPSFSGWRGKWTKFQSLLISNFDSNLFTHFVRSN